MAGLLAEIYSAGDTAKRKLRGLLDDPMGTLTQFVNNENDRAGQFNQLTSQATDEMTNRIKGGGRGMGASEQRLAGLLADAYNPTGMFIGASAKTWDKAAAEKAQKLLKAGADPKQVWKETGTFKGADGALRQEIDDSAADFPIVKKYRRSDLDASVVHEPLEAAYPDVKGIQLEFAPGGTLSGGEYRPKVQFHDIGPRESIVLHNSELSRSNNKSIGLHEMQHAIQQREGWAKGGSPDSAFIERNLSDLTPLVNPQSIYASGAKTTTQGPIMVVNDEGKLLITDGNHRYAEALKRGDKTIKTHFDPTFFDGYGGNMDQAVKDAANENYMRLAGEAEARATQARMNMNAQQRRDVYPFDSYDVPTDQLIVRGLLGQ